MTRKILAIFMSVALAFLIGCGSSSDTTPPPPTITIRVTSGSGQIATIGAAFAAPLIATVTSNGSPATGVSVTFTAPSSGASGTFVNGNTTETDTTNSSGVATSSIFTANTTSGAFTVTATTSGASAAASFNLTNTASTAMYSFYLSGAEAINGGDNYYAIAGSVIIDSDGNVVGGEQDYNDAWGLTSPQPSGDLITGGTLTVDNVAQGTLTLITNNPALGINGTETFGIQGVNSNHALIIQFDGSGTASGSIDLQTLPSTLSGGYAFALSGVDVDYYSFAVGGIFTIDGTSLNNGIMDLNDDGYVSLGTPFTGTVSAPDSFGRGTITGSDIGTAINYYIIGPGAMRLIDVDSDMAAVGSAFGQGTNATAASNASLGSSVFGCESNSYGYLYAAAGMLATDPAGATFEGVADIDEEGWVVSASPISGNYVINANGYGSLAISNLGLMDATNLGVYMTDPNLNLLDPNNPMGAGGALVLDLSPYLSGGMGVLIPQTDTSTGSFTLDYAFGEQNFNVAWEFDLAGVGSVDLSGNFAGTGLVSDPYLFFDVNPANYTAVPLAAAFTADTLNPGRYTTSVFEITAPAGSPEDFQVALYQANGDQLFWIGEDDFSLSLGTMQLYETLAARNRHGAIGTLTKPGVKPHIRRRR